MLVQELLEKHYDQVGRIVRHHAARMARTQLFAPKDWDDLAQDLWMHLLRRARNYAPARSAFPTFASRVVCRRARDMVRRALKRKARPATVSLHDMIPDGRQQVERIATIPSNAGDRFSGKVTRAETKACDLRLDVRHVVSLLPADLQQICHKIAGTPSFSTAALMKALSHSRDHIDPRLAKIREHFKRHGLDGYLA